MTSSSYILSQRGNSVVLVSITVMLIPVRIRVGIKKLERAARVRESIGRVDPRL